MSTPSPSLRGSPLKTSSSFTITRWVTLAIASGAFAALNGLFAKLTTTESTGSAASKIAHAFNLPEGMVEIIVRAICFGLNLLSNFIMWALFTRALTAAPSTTKVSITNTSANFLVTAVLGMIVFRERVGGLWWLGAVMMGAGCILVGMRDDSTSHKEVSEGEGVVPSVDGDDEVETITLREDGFDDEIEPEPYRDEVER
ncbi:conserved hypothetical protein [Talaromyces stipitatus ATCC 10500]|uniref:Uncharacterized protein n=1 Tax=Talaromyces stipitatus (strain ATCC 10500 / CBS 375.48 / QM 6759 / NRRL 1006) TaxID=441959 RepID=B8M1N2_TALSN|nr:uncharacterized protein TSTA_093650 [Talaromyces stipitatus ATCC 10500]EED22119.1 conserved hypothetical protein [Talaromyces stipitatus ATCC 10500]